MKKIVINGHAVEGAPKQVTVSIAKAEVTLTLVYVGADEKVDAQFNWAPVASKPSIACKTVKVGNRVATTILDGDKVVFSNLTAQSVFAVVKAAFGQSVGVTDALYKKANPARKESAKGATSKVVLTEKGNW